MMEITKGIARMNNIRNMFHEQFLNKIQFQCLCLRNHIGYDINMSLLNNCRFKVEDNIPNKFIIFRDYKNVIGCVEE